jgi:hypothetical protein
MADFKPWEKSATNLLVVYSILAAISIGLIGLVIQERSKLIYGIFILILILLSISTILFIFSAEKLTDSIEESSVEKYIDTLKVYNVSVVSLITAFVIFIMNVIFQKGYLFLLILPVIIGLIISIHWICDYLWLSCRSYKKERDSWVLKISRETKV